MHLIFKIGSKKIVELLIKLGEDVNAVNNKGKTVLHYASRNDQPEIVSLLLENGASVNVVDKLGRTPLYFAVSRDSEKPVELLVKNKANVNIAEKHGKTPLHEGKLCNSLIFNSLTLFFYMKLRNTDTSQLQRFLLIMVLI